MKVEATLRGGAKLKKNPHFNVIWGEYRGKIISKSEAYLDHRFILIGHSEDVRYLDAYEGKRLVDRTKVGQPWALTPHSFETRSNAMRLFRELKIRPRRLVDGVATYKALLEDRARKTPTKQIAKELARLEREERSQNARVIVPSQADPNVETTPDVAIPELEVVVSEPEPQPVPPPWRRRRGVSFF